MLKYRASVLFLIVFLALLLPNPFFVLRYIPSAKAATYGANWLTGWAFRKQHNITSASGAGTNYQLSVTVCNGTGTDSGNVVYENNEAKADFSDVRITDNTGVGLLFYWNQTVNTGMNATFWFRDTDDLTARNSTIYVYYGNSGETWDSAYCGEAGTFVDVVANDVLALAMDEGSGATAYDKSGNGNDGILLPAGSEPLWVTGKYGSALSFNGVNSYVDIPASATLPFNGTNPWTIEMWVNYTSGYVYYPQFCKGTYGNGPGFTIHGSYGRIQGGNGTSGFDQSEMWQTDLRGQGWQYTVMTYDGSVFRAYLDGQEEGTFQWGGGIGNTSGYDIWLGKFWGPSYNGAIDEVHIYNRALSQTEISDLFTNYGDSTLDPGKVLVRKYTSLAPSNGAWGIEETANPTYSGVSVSSTVAGQPAQFSCLWQTTTNMSGFIFSTNNTGSWMNDTWTDAWSSWPTAMSAWANVTKTLNDTAGYTVSYSWYANDTSNNWGSSGQYDLTLMANLQMSPDTVTCRKYLETFVVQVNVTNAIDAQAFNFTLYYEPTLVNYSSVSWGELGTGTLTTVDTTNGIIEGNVAGPATSGNCWLLNITFQDTATLIWKRDQVNELDGQIWFHYASLNFSGVQLTYEEGGLGQISVNNVAFAFVPIQGDVNNVGIVNLLDLGIVAYYYGVKQGDLAWFTASAYDLNRNNIIDIYDIVLIAQNFGYTYP